MHGLAISALMQVDEASCVLIHRWIGPHEPGVAKDPLAALPGILAAEEGEEGRRHAKNGRLETQEHPILSRQLHGVAPHSVSGFISA
jgi:hypothetical protein